MFRTSGKKEHLDENDFRHGYGNYFESAILEFPCQHWRGTLTKTFERHLAVEYFTEMDQHTCLNGAVKLAVVQMSEPVLWWTFHVLLYFT